MKKYNALDNVRAAAELSIQLRLEADDLTASLDYAEFVLHESSDDLDVRNAQIVLIRALASDLASYAGTEAVAEAQS